MKKSNFKNILFIGGVFQKDKEKNIVKKSKGPIQYAANTLQWNFINGIEENINRNIEILNAVFVSSYPKYYDEIWIKKELWSHKDDSNDIDIGFLNLFGIKNVFRCINIKKNIFKWYKKDLNNRNIIIYSMHLPFIYAAVEVKKIFNDLNIVLIVPDLPEFMDLSMNKNKIKKFLKNIDRKVIYSKLKYIDSFVLLTEHMKEKLNISENQKYEVIEGMCESNINFSNKINSISDKEKILLYTGTLQKQYGILDLLEAFSNLNHCNLKLWICGDGDAKDDVILACKENKKITYFGQVCRNEALKLQEKSTILVNPRRSSGEYTKYSFPSKTMEYLLAGKPVVMRKLDGIPKEYEEYLFFTKDDSVDSLTNEIYKLYMKSDEELEYIGRKGKEFVVNEKNYIVQSNKLINLLK
ncbi:glycosyltransferase [Clostridium perfringens]